MLTDTILHPEVPVLPLEGQAHSAFGFAVECKAYIALGKIFRVVIGLGNEQSGFVSEAAALSLDGDILEAVASAERLSEAPRRLICTGGSRLVRPPGD